VWQEKCKEEMNGLEKRMAIASDILEKILKENFQEAHIILKDLVGDADHYEVTIVSHAFEGKKRIQRHQAVYQALGNMVGGQLHALSVKTYTPQEYETSKEK
jgi:stress-induced morphogen